MCYTGRGPMRIGSLREAGVVDPVEIELLEHALAMIGTRACKERALVSAWLAFAYYNAERTGLRRELVQSAVEIALTLDDPAVLAECLMLAQGSVRGPAELDARRARGSSPSWWHGASDCASGTPRMAIKAGRASHVIALPGGRSHVTVATRFGS